MEVGERIKKRRKELKMTQEELAKLVGYTSRSAIAKVETNANGILQNKVNSFARALRTSPGYLLGWEEDAGTVTEESRLMYQKEDAIADIFDKLHTDSIFFDAVKKIYSLSEQQLEGLIVMLDSFE